jgi:hypothetical protein
MRKLSRVPLAAGLLALFFLGAGCASHEVKALSPEPLSTYQLRQTVFDVDVAASPLTTKADCERVFTVDLTEQGFAPILLVMENRSGDNILVRRDEIELTDSRGNPHKPTPSEVMVEKFEHNKMSYAVFGFGLLSYMSADEANKKMRQDWGSKELPGEKILLPNRKAYGVVYFDMGQGLSAFPNSNLAVLLENLRNGEKRSVTFRMP